jgi:hypothetical protein
VADTPKKPAKAKSDAKPAMKKVAKKPAAGAREAGVAPQSEETYRKSKAAIDKVLELCTGHLKQIGEPELALEVIRRLKDYYLKHGVGTPKSGGFR